jgi:Holliday junction resolvase RusA-like endonuclease
MSYKIVIIGDPIAKKRPKFARRGNFVSVYDTQKKETDDIKIQMLAQWPHKPIETGLEIEILFFMPIPASWSKKRKESALKSETHKTKPDLDNLVKFFFDSMNDVIYSDDRLIYKLTSGKWYDLNPRTEIYIYQK